MSLFFSSLWSLVQDERGSPGKMLWQWITGSMAAAVWALGPLYRLACWLEPELPGGAAGLVTSFVCLDSKTDGSIEYQLTV